MKTDKFITVVVGERIGNPDNRSFLIAPTGYHFATNDEVVTKFGRGFKVLFASSYVTVDSELFVALKNALGSPIKISLYKAVENVEWGDENEDAADSVSSDDTCRSGREVGTGTNEP